jgi:hypothetical protein
MGLSGKANVVRLFMDESGNGNPDQPLIIGAVELGEDASAIEAQIQSLYARLAARNTYTGQPGFDEFRQHGFHSSTDPREVSGPFLELLQTFIFRTYMMLTDRSGVPGSTEIERIEYMYANLLSDLLIRYRDQPQLLCTIEQSEGMGSVIRRLPSSAMALAREKIGPRANLPELRIDIASKLSCMSMAIIDYVMSAVARWLKADRTVRSEDYAYRAFSDIEPSISILYSFELGRISSRKDSLH